MLIVLIVFISEIHDRRTVGTHVRNGSEGQGQGSRKRVSVRSIGQGQVGSASPKENPFQISLSKANLNRVLLLA
jgi:hypothetical protein